MPTRDDVFRVLAGIARGARGGIMESRENDRQEKQDELNNLLRDFQMKRAQADAEWTDTERYGSPDVGASADRLAEVLQPSVTADSPYRGPTARGPGGMVGVPRREAPPEDPLAAAISGVSRPSLRMVNGRMRDPSTSRRALDRTERLQDRVADRTADVEDFEAKEKIRAKFAPPVSRPPNYQRIVGPDGRVKFYDPTTGKTVDSGLNERVPEGPKPPAADNEAELMALARRFAAAANGDFEKADTMWRDMLVGMKPADARRLAGYRQTHTRAAVNEYNNRNDSGGAPFSTAPPAGVRPVGGSAPSAPPPPTAANPAVEREKAMAAEAMAIATTDEQRAQIQQALEKRIAEIRAGG